MSGIYIPGINLPRAEDDWTLELFVDSNGEVEAHTVTGIRTLKAIEFPPHGRLIDADATLFEAKRISGPITGDGWSNWGVYALIERQPTIIPADGGE